MLYSLDEAIEHCEQKSCSDTECANEHRQLAEWLKELKAYRKTCENLKVEAFHKSNKTDELVNDLKV